MLFGVPNAGELERSRNAGESRTVGEAAKKQTGDVATLGTGSGGAEDTCGVWRGALRRGMKIRHKGLRGLHGRDKPAQLPAGLVPRLKRIMFRLQEATHPRSAGAPGFPLHPLKGDRADQWRVRVSGNWRVVFRFEDGEAMGVDLIDYH